jgi:hypothetical protein
MKKILQNRITINGLIILLLITSLSCTQVIQKNIDQKPRVEVSTNDMDNNILRFINQHRRSLGLPVLQMVSAASQQAYQHSRNMALRKTGFGHEGFENRMAIIGKTEGWITASAENVAYGKLSAEEVVKEIEAAGQKAVALHLDTNDFHSLDGFIETVKETLQQKWGVSHFDFMINNGKGLSNLSVDLP